MAAYLAWYTSWNSSTQLRLLSIGSIDVFNDHFTIDWAFIVFALTALTVVTAEYSSLEAFAILFEAPRLFASTPLNNIVIRYQRLKDLNNMEFVILGFSPYLKLLTFECLPLMAAWVPPGVLSIPYPWLEEPPVTILWRWPPPPTTDYIKELIWFAPLPPSRIIIWLGFI